MNIGYVTVNDVLNKSAWSKHEQGLWAASHYISKHLEDDLTSLDYIHPTFNNFRFLTRTKWSIYRYIFKRDYYAWAEPLVLADYANQVEKKLLNLKIDLVLCPENIVPIAYLECRQPIVLWTDSTLNSLRNFYPHMNNLCEENIKTIYTMEGAALNRCQMLIYTSDWAAQKAIDTYGISPSKIKVLPWGANLECNRNMEVIRDLVRAKPSSPCKLLFIAVDWVRKGGNFALKVAQKLNNIGFKTELIIVGCQPIINQNLPTYVKVIDFIDKSTNEGLEKINKLFAEAHFLVLPSIADCTPIVFAEANSFGVPCLSTKVGGIETIIKDEINGKTFALEASVSDYCKYIISIMNNYKTYKDLAVSSFDQYKSRLNWSVTVQKAKQLMKELIA